MRRLLVAVVVLVLAVPAGSGARVAPDGAGTAPSGGAAERCLLAPHDHEPIGLGACPGARPGAAVQTSQGSCTLNFVVRGTPREDAARTFIGTAGHCVLAEPGERTWAAGAGPEARDGSGAPLGRVVYARLDETGDYALIEPLRDVAVEPAMCHFAGPSGTAGPSGDTTVLLQHTGRGLGVSAVAPGRTGLARRFDHPTEVRMDAVASLGDSGGPVARSGQAVGVVVSIGSNLGGPVRVLRLGPMLDRAGSRLGLSMMLVPAAQ